MNLTLKRTDYREDGCFGNIFDESGKQIGVTLEHAFDAGHGIGSYAPKIPPGTYKCVRGQHRLDHSTSPFETFEVTGVQGHSGILFHVGNYNKDSDGCILVGHGYGGDPRMIYQSKMTFDSFMNLQHNVNEFTLTVED
jgi:hypothetical protein